MRPASVSDGRAFDLLPLRYIAPARQTAAEVSVPHELPTTKLCGRRYARLDRASKILLFAAHEAWVQSGWEPGEQIPIVLGTTSGGMSLGEAYYRQALATPDDQRGQPTRVSHYQAQRQSARPR